MKTKGEPSGSPFFRNSKYSDYSNMVRRAIKRNNNRRNEEDLNGRKTNR